MMVASSTTLDSLNRVMAPKDTISVDASPRRHTIWIRSETFVPAWTDLGPMLEAQLPVRFTFAAEPEEAVSGEILVGAASARMGRGPICPTLQVPAATINRDAKLANITVEFADHPEVPFPFRGRIVQTEVAIAPQALALEPGDITLASTDAGAVWAASISNGQRHYKSSFPIPTIPADGNFRDVLHGGRFIEMLPVIHWLRQVTGEDRYEGLPLRAQFMFDDPNLHWPKYGFVDFAKIVEHAQKENYHVSFATVPLDVWFTHQGAAEIFRRNPKHISFLIHGNNHTHKELLGDYTGSQRSALLRQAVRRIEKLERKARLTVPRAMAAPHGACSDAMLGDLARCGFECATISHGSQRVHNADKPWTKNLGYLPSEIIHGCPVLPRWSMTSPGVENIILLAAYLRQPIILIGHHQDLRGGIGLLDKLARFINGLGPVIWGDMTDLSRINYLQYTDGSTVRLRPLSRKLRMQLPSGAKRLVVENPQNYAWGEWKITNRAGVTIQLTPGDNLLITPELSGSLTLEQMPPAGEQAEQSPEPKLSMKALARRLLTEARDRFLAK